MLPSVNEGVEGDIVEFTVQPNDKEVDQVFTYDFVCGKKHATFQITLTKKASQTEEQLEVIYTEGGQYAACRRRYGQGVRYELRRVDPRRIVWLRSPVRNDR